MHGYSGVNFATDSVASVFWPVLLAIGKSDSVNETSGDLVLFLHLPVLQTSLKVLSCGFSVWGYI